MTFSFADGLFWLSVACCALAQFFILRSVGGTHDAPATAASLPRPRGSLEMLWAVLPAIGLAVLLVFTWRAVRATATGAVTPSLLEPAGAGK